MKGRGDPAKPRPRLAKAVEHSDKQIARTYFALADEPDYANRVGLYNAIAEQIWREQQLVSTRMQWNFTFQAFLAGIYVYAGSELDPWQGMLVQGVLCTTGFFVSLFCLLGVLAAQKQSSRLKEHWVAEFHPHPHPMDAGDCDIKRGAFPQPFSSKSGSSRGRFASRGVCYALMFMWVMLLGIAVGAMIYLP